MSRPLRVAVVGSGVMGRYHALNYATMPRVELVAMVDIDPERREEMRQTYGCATYATGEELLAHERRDAASVAGPCVPPRTPTQVRAAAGPRVGRETRH